METIRNYLESMFADLPNTAAVLKAKQELYSMMEDKYTELREEGKAENEAIGIVISEFGNLDELAETLGIAHALVETEEKQLDRHHISAEEAEQYMSDMAKHRLFIGIGVMLCIICPVGFLLTDFLRNKSFATFGVAFFFLSIALGVGLMVYSSSCIKMWDFLKKYPCSIDYATAERIYMEQEYRRTDRSLRLTIGIILCVVSVVPPAVLGTLSKNYYLTEGLGPAMMFLCVGIGVLLIIVSGGRSNAGKTLLSLNDMETVSGNYESTVSGAKPRIKNKDLRGYMDIYWKAVTCVYLIWSFLTFDWGRTWLIFPVAALVKSLIENVFGREEEKHE